MTGEQASRGRDKVERWAKGNTEKQKQHRRINKDERLGEGKQSEEAV